MSGCLPNRKRHVRKKAQEDVDQKDRVVIQRNSEEEDVKTMKAQYAALMAENAELKAQLEAANASNVDLQASNAAKDQTIDALLRRNIISLVEQLSSLQSQTSITTGELVLQHLVVEEKKDAQQFLERAMPKMELEFTAFEELKSIYGLWANYAEILSAFVKPPKGDAARKGKQQRPVESEYHKGLMELFLLVNFGGHLKRCDERHGTFRPDYFVSRPGMPELTKLQVEAKDNFSLSQMMELQLQSECDALRNVETVKHNGVKASLSDVVEWLNGNLRVSPRNKSKGKEVKVQSTFPLAIYSVIEIKRFETFGSVDFVELPREDVTRMAKISTWDGWFQVVGRAFTRCCANIGSMADNLPNTFPFIGAFTNGHNFVCLTVSPSEELIQFVEGNRLEPPDKMFKVMHRQCLLASKEAALYVTLLCNFGCGPEFQFRAAAEPLFGPTNDDDTLFTSVIDGQRFQVFRELTSAERTVSVAKDAGGEMVILKSSSMENSGLDHEKEVLEFLQSKAVSGIPKIQWFGQNQWNSATLCLTPVGLSLDKLLERGVRVDLNHICRSLKQTLLEIHNSGVVHCDVKPSNIVLVNDQEAILIDFHLATKKDQPRKGFTAMFASLNSSIGGMSNFSDDWESLIYTLAFIHNGGNLPWTMDYGNVHQQSYQMRIDFLQELCSNPNPPVWVEPLREELHSIVKEIPMSREQQVQHVVSNTIQNLAFHFNRQD
jgi:predicted Ser/Thr protein kinase